ncbi:uronyl 2-sulfotransferase isoform X1 [Hylobates moloch]|uniref:uronyl 2-sulfotransferase isoform X1 n=2 Tax=Hylobates moloch TaxID=81572 RepID=UPI0013623934|nr:uronyl 2-sulfotransferase isoform X1 [Hylobates moloch]XP_055122781.1 uronyl 2-sulfotransferase isoform X1 [Symphalangus syndactylus]XP_055122791.1 uronyl 2-sulfotransferase isoform X1 [Symphalangus syndactylus]
MKKKQQHPGGGADPWPHGAPLGGAPPGLGSWKRRVSLLPFLRFSLRDYGFCMATLLVFCLGSLLYQLSGGPPRFLLDLRQYLGNSTYLDDHGPPPSKVLPFPSQVVYNRVGKCGSRTVVLLLRILSEKHGFNLVTSDIHNKTRLTKNEQMELIKNISTAEQPYLFTRHVHFLNFSRFGGDQPVYINIIRDPVNRFLSNYFFRRFGDWRGEQNHMIRTPSMRQEERYLDINECILENYPECSNPRLFYIIPYFCGQHPRCREPGEWALERAKLNVNENFLLVGILEELEDVLLLLERFLPHYFKGVLSIYKDPEHRKLGNMTVTVKKTVPSPEAVQILYQRMRYEYEFYHYVKEQFHLLKRKFGLKSHVSKHPLRPHFFIPTPLETEEPIDDEEQDDEKWLEDIYKRPCHVPRSMLEEEDLAVTKTKSLTSRS